MKLRCDLTVPSRGSAYLAAFGSYVVMWIQLPGTKYIPSRLGWKWAMIGLMLGQIATVSLP